MASIKNIGKKTEHAKHIYKKKKLKQIFLKNLYKLVLKPQIILSTTLKWKVTLSNCMLGEKNKIDQNINF